MAESKRLQGILDAVRNHVQTLKLSLDGRKENEGHEDGQLFLNAVITNIR